MKQKKFKMITFRVDAKTAREYKRCADACDMRLSEYLRAAAKRECEFVELMKQETKEDAGE